MFEYIRAGWVFVWIVFAFLVTGLCGAMYVTAQQVLRQSANDPQIELAENVAARLATGESPASVVSSKVSSNTPLIDLATSVSPWVAVYDTSGAPIQASARLDGALPQPPKGLFDTGSWTTLKRFETPLGLETRVTWEPNAKVRQALVLIKTSGGNFVASGRSLRDSEDRVVSVGQTILTAWAVLLVMGTFYFFLVGRLHKPR